MSRGIEIGRIAADPVRVASFAPDKVAGGSGGSPDCASRGRGARSSLTTAPPCVLTIYCPLKSGTSAAVVHPQIVRSSIHTKLRRETDRDARDPEFKWFVAI